MILALDSLVGKTREISKSHQLKKEWASMILKELGFSLERDIPFTKDINKMILVLGLGAAMKTQKFTSQNLRQELASTLRKANGFFRLSIKKVSLMFRTSEQNRLKII